MFVCSDQLCTPHSPTQRILMLEMWACEKAPLRCLHANSFLLYVFCSETRKNFLGDVADNFANLEEYTALWTAPCKGSKCNTVKGTLEVCSMDLSLVHNVFLDVKCETGWTYLGVNALFPPHRNQFIHEAGQCCIMTWP